MSFNNQLVMCWRWGSDKIVYFCYLNNTRQAGCLSCKRISNDLLSDSSDVKMLGTQLDSPDDRQAPEIINSNLGIEMFQSVRNFPL